ncbi:hypothetical protein [Streptomyces sp. 891-h]|uniref:hypothetical protein n=1 Tax=Streptomyces sp. 891-h TaxID=2720714 RepID=UPI001FAA1073|nr:hypothetical protein [Streptomyces sp. 891-h]UNZ21401.1 hypothetical protein HC362_34475 [Streptomyces sp. 891-h]
MRSQRNRMRAARLVQWRSTLGTGCVVVTLVAATALVWLAGCGPSLLPETGEAFNGQPAQQHSQPSEQELSSDPCDLAAGPVRDVCREDGSPRTEEPGGAPSRPQVALLACSALGLGGVWLLAGRRLR